MRELRPGTLQKLNEKAYRQGYSKGRYVTVVCRQGDKITTVSPCGVWYEHEDRDFVADGPQHNQLPPTEAKEVIK